MSIDGNAGAGTNAAFRAPSKWSKNEAYPSTWPAQQCSPHPPVSATTGTRSNDTFNLYAGNNHLFYGDSGNDRFNVLAATTGLALHGGIVNDDFYGYGHAITGSVYGEAGNDSFLYFRGASATLNGGTGNDTYMVDATSSATFVEASGEGTDLVYVPRGYSYTLGANMEYLTVRGYSGGTTADATLTGNSLNNTIRGHNNNETINGGGGNDVLRSYGGNDTLNGGEGNDRLEGGTGDDTMAGGDGDDTYFVDSSADVVIENGLQGTDTVRMTISDSLDANVENGVLRGTADLNIGGNAGDNILYGNSGHNALMIGGDGNDRIYGGDGGDGLVGDALEGGGAAGTDILDGGAGNDNFLGGGGADTMTGGSGDDSFYYIFTSDSTDAVRDQITDFLSISGGGGDRLQLSDIDANVNVAGNQDFLGYTDNVATAYSVWYDQATVVVNGDGTYEVTVMADVTEIPRQSW